MSTFICSLLFFFFFLCLSIMHTCNARHLRVLMDENIASHKKHLFSTKVLESVNRLNKDEPISVDEEGRSGDCITFPESDAMKPKGAESDSHSLHREMKQNREISSVAVPKAMKPLVSVSFHSGRLPRKNLDERSGFFSDYSRPRTRPPSHN